jgi:hypothetical protein
MRRACRRQLRLSHGDRQFGQFAKAALLFLAAMSVALPTPASAINWEGHDAWFHDNTLFQEFIEGVPPPITKPLPTCDELRKRQQQNSYEQVPLSGRNCKDT